MQTFNLNPFTPAEFYQGAARLVQVEGTGAAEREFELGLVSATELEVTSESTPVYGSNEGVRKKYDSLPGETEAKLPFTVQSLTDKIRAWSVLGYEQAANLTADPNWSKQVGAIAVADRIPLGRPVNAIKIDGMEEGVDFSVLDNGRAVLIKAKPAGVTAPVTISGSAPAFADSLKVTVGGNPNRVVRLRLYGNERNKRHFTLDVKGIVRPASAVGYIGETDVIGAEFELEIIADENGDLGTLIIF